MGVLNALLRVLGRQGRGALLIGLCVLGALHGPAHPARSAPYPQEAVAGRQTMGLEYRRNVPTLFGYGITADLLDQPVNALLNGVAAMHLNWIRQSVRWADVEPLEGAYSWDSLDVAVNEVRIRGFHLLLVIHGTPDWALPEFAADAEDGPPADPATLTHFLGVLSARYAGVVDAYQIWQDPNLGACWNGQPDPQAYSQLLQHAYRAIKAADPGALVISADLASGWHESEESFVDGLRFLAEMNRFGASGSYDALGMALDPSAASPVRLLMDARQVAAGDRGVPVWITRAGWSCAGADSDAMPACEERQADYLVHLSSEVDQLAFVQAFIVDNFNLSTIDANHPAAGKSLIRSDWSPRPAFLEYARMRQEQLMAAERVATATTHNRAPQSGPKLEHKVTE